MWRRQVQKTYEYAGSDSIPSSDIFIAQQDSLYIVTNHPVSKDVLAPLQILALDIYTGHQRWASEPLGHIHSLAASPTTLFVASVDGISAYDARNGSKKWTSNQPPPAHESYRISFDDGKVYLITDRNARYLYTQIDPETGAVGSFQESNRALSKIDSEYRYTQQPIGTLWVEDIKSGQARQIITRPRSADPIRENIILAIPYLKQITSVWHSVTVLELTTGQVLWECEECFASDIAVDNGKLYAIRQDGSLIEYDLKTGKIIGLVEFSGVSRIDPSTTLYSITASNGYVLLFWGDTQELIALGPEK
jgi:outer membrane protein assembly factor BamB